MPGGPAGGTGQTATQRAMIVRMQIGRIAPELEPLLVPLDSVTRWPGNAKKHDVKAIGRSIETHGYTDPMVVQASSRQIMAGNGRHEALEGLGWTHAPMVFVDMSDTEALRFVLLHNRSQELGGGYEEDALAALIRQAKAEAGGDDLAELTGWTDADLDLLLADSDAEPFTEDGGGDGSGAESDGVIRPPDQPVTRRGDVWMLGDHRLMCGDSRDPGDVSQLLAGVAVNVAFTSPPYAAQREYDDTSGFLPVPADDYVSWFAPVAENVGRHLAGDGSWFINIKPHAYELDTHLYVMDLVIAHVRAWGWHFGTEYCWERGGMPGTPFRRFKNQFEPVFQFARGEWKFRPLRVRSLSDDVPKSMPKGLSKKSSSIQGSVRAMDDNERGEGMAYPGNRLPAFRQLGLTGHPAVFPVNLPRFFIRAYGDPGDSVFDPFCGSGSTLLAAHAEECTGYGMELSPAYCDMICARWERQTGVIPIREADGMPVSFADTLDAVPMP